MTAPTPPSVATTPAPTLALTAAAAPPPPSRPTAAPPPAGLTFTVGGKVAAGLAVIVTLGLISMLLIYRGLVIVEREVNRLAQVDGPLTAAAYEMEVNVNGIGFAVLKYLATGGQRYRDWVTEDDGDFANYHATYELGVGTEAERALAQEISRHYDEYVALGRQLMDRYDEQTARFTELVTTFDDVEKLIARDWRGVRKSPAEASAPASPPVSAFLEEMRATAKGMVLKLTAERLPSNERDPEALQRLIDQFESGLARFDDAIADHADRNAGAAPAIEAAAAALREQFTRIYDRIPPYLAQQEAIDAHRLQFVEKRYRMDELLDDEIQILLAENLDRPRRRANAAAEQVISTLGYLVPVFVLAAVTVAFLLVRNLRRPLRDLERAAAAVGRGDLEVRISPAGRDELADLAHAFNTMVTRLRETTVSRELLVQSEELLRQTVVDLRREISERVRGQHERELLQARLRRSETMSAMGALVAGVAHEVRNPLFGISSTLDALDARMAGRGDYARYGEVLRGEVARLGKLMADLLEFGRPTPDTMAVDAVELVIAKAVSSALPLAQSCNVEIQCRLESPATSIRMARDRLAQCFVNLIENAVQHSPRGSTVRIETAEVVADEQGWIECRIRDSGPGFREADLPRLFEPFFSRRRGGTGLGLSIVQRIIEEHGGTIHAANDPRGGAVMTLRLPRFEPVPAAGDRQSTDEQQEDPRRR